MFIPKCTEEGGSTGLGNIPTKTIFLLLPLQKTHAHLCRYVSKLSSGP